MNFRVYLLKMKHLLLTVSSFELSYEEVLLSEDQIKQAIVIIKENIDTFEPSKIICLLKDYFKSDLSLKIDENILNDNLTNSDPNKSILESWIEEK